MERCLYHCKTTNKDTQKNYEDAICFKKNLVFKHFHIPKCDVHILWMTIGFTLVF